MGTDTSFAVRAQIFDARDHSVNLTSTAGSDSYVGTKLKDTLSGTQCNDILKGGVGNDRITGGLGSDEPTRGIGADVFLFANAAQAGNGAGRNRITDFAHGVNPTNYHAVMAGGHFIGSGAFGGGDGPLVNFNATTGILQGVVTGNGTADFSLKLDGVMLLMAGDFIF